MQCLEEMARLKVPESFEKALLTVDKAEGSIDAQQIETALREARALLDPADQDGAWPDLVAFAFAAGGESPWGTYFGPFGSKGMEDGGIAFFPDLREVSPDVLVHWTERAKSLTHPVLRARYADLVWDLGGRVSNKPEVEFAQIAIDDYNQAVGQKRLSDLHGEIGAGSRALALAISINDPERIGTSRDLMLQLFTRSIEEDAGWWDLFRSLTQRRAEVTPEQKAKMVGQLEALLAKSADHSNPTTFNPHRVEELAKLLVPYYGRETRFDDIKRTYRAVSVAYEHIAEIGSALQAISWLETSIAFAQRAGEADEVNRLRMLREEAVSRAPDEMRQLSFTGEIKREDMNAFLAAIIQKQWPNTLARIASAFVHGKEEYRRHADNFAKAAVIASLVSTEILSGDHVAAKIGPAAEDPEGHLYQQADRTLQIDASFLDRALEQAQESHGISYEEVTAFGWRSELFPDFMLLRSGVKAWVEGDYVKALFVLIPQVEAALRKFASNLGESVTKPKKGADGWEISLNMGDLLANKAVQDALGEDLLFHFRAVFSDPRGWNLRNRIAHGMVPFEGANYMTCNLTIHAVLVIGVLQQMAEARRREKPKRSATEAG